MLAGKTFNYGAFKHVVQRADRSPSDKCYLYYYSFKSGRISSAQFKANTAKVEIFFQNVYSKYLFDPTKFCDDKSGVLLLTYAVWGDLCLHLMLQNGLKS